MSNKGHIHAELMAQYAEDAKVHTEPWELWQTKPESSDWLALHHNPSWHPTCEYRRKPKTHIVHGVEIPDLRIIPVNGQEYWHPDPTGDALVFRSTRKEWLSADRHRVENNMCYELTEEGKQAAILHAKAWLGIDIGASDKL